MTDLEKVANGTNVVFGNFQTVRKFAKLSTTNQGKYGNLVLPTQNFLVTLLVGSGHSDFTKDESYKVKHKVKCDFFLLLIIT